MTRTPGVSSSASGLTLTPSSSLLRSSKVLRSIDTINVTGGGARLPYWGQLLAAALNRPLTYRVGGEVGAALGAARLGRLALKGPQSHTDICAAPPVDRVVQPDVSLSSLLATRRQTFKRLYQDLKNIFVEYSQ
jgi:xylulokinase